jgi:hypothetical protein
MKRVILTIAAMALSVNAFADGKSQAMLSALAAKVASWGDYRVEFAVTIDGQSLAGSYEVGGESYRVVTPDIEIYCDGTTRREVNRLDREVAVDRVDPDDRTVLGNPTHLFDFLDGSYTHRYVGVALIDGVKCEHIELTEAIGAGNGNAPAAGNGTGAGTSVGTGAGVRAGQKIDVFLRAEGGVPVRVVYTMDFMNTGATVDVVRVTPHVTLDAAFRYDPQRYPGYETIDFR